MVRLSERDEATVNVSDESNHDFTAIASTTARTIRKWRTERQSYLEDKRLVDVLLCHVRLEVGGLEEAKEELVDELERDEVMITMIAGDVDDNGDVMRSS